MKKFHTYIIYTTTLALFAGCASIPGTSNEIEKNTARSLGLNIGSFTISNQENGVLKTTYTATSNAGKKFNCYVTGGSILTSDAVCVEINGSTNQNTQPATASCNALLKAAGRCN